MPEKDIPTPYNYKIDELDNTTYLFETNKLIGYAIKFKPTGYIFEEYIWAVYCYEYVIEVKYNPTEIPPPFDASFSLTIATIFNDFFRDKEKVVTYICNTADGKELARFRKFNIWFNKFNTNFFLKIDKSFYDSRHNTTYYNSLIIRQDNPFKIEIIEAFEDLIGGFDEDK
ncbi:MAG: DUF6169 family protein [Arcicella sp.]|jgi:hypothetical protein|nr:DUF6169 family protein [Arcicella sp.]